MPHEATSKSGTSAYVKMLSGERRRHGAMGAVQRLPMELPMSQHSRFDASRSLTALEQHSTIVAVIEMNQRSGWLRRSFPASNVNLLRSSMPTRKRC